MLRTLPKTLLLVISLTATGRAQDMVLQFVPSQTKVQFALDATMHTVHGSFLLKHGTVHYHRGTGAISGEVVIDATSGNTGNPGRDRKMHGEVLESAKFPEIVFRPDRVDGSVSPEGMSSVQVHGTFTIHGGIHEITLPMQVELGPGGWTAATHFDIPFLDWGLKNPSTFLLHVGREVNLEVEASGVRP